MDNLLFYIAERCIEIDEVVRTYKMETGEAIYTNIITVEPVWDEITEATVLKVVFKGMERWFNTASEVIGWLQDRLEPPVNRLPLLDLLGSN